MEDADLEGITSHSCKATLLSWATKARGLAHGSRCARGGAKSGVGWSLEEDLW